MKKIILFGLLSLGFIGSSVAQSFKNYKPSAMHFAHGFNVDAYGGQMSMDWMKARTTSEQPFKEDLSSLTEDAWSATAGYNLLAQLVMSDPDNSTRPELRLGVGATIWKEAVVDFQDEDNYASVSDLMYCFVENEVNVSAELLWRKSAYRFSAYAGVGANAAASLSNTLYLFRYVEYSGRPGNSTFTETTSDGIEEWRGKNVVYARAYAPLGLSIKLFKHMELTFEQRLGIGAASVTDGSQANILFNATTNFGLRYNFAVDQSPRFLY
jgi:hypothetical protein